MPLRSLGLDKVGNERRVKFLPVVLVSELLGWVRNVVLINVYSDLENPGGSGFRVGGYMSQIREWGS